jgi:hypothetical protein
MADGSSPSVVLPERIDRPMRLGPFPSARAALKFVTYCAVGALFVPFAGGLAWLPFLIVGFLVSVHRPGEKGPDERIAEFLRYRVRLSGMLPASSGEADGRVRGSLIRLGSGRYVAIVETRGTPIVHLPPGEIEQLFTCYRDFLRGLDNGGAFIASVAPLPAIAFEPISRRADSGAGLSEARSGYDELVRLLCRRRFTRRIFFALWSDNPSMPSVAQLEERVALAIDHFQRLGVAPVRLRGVRLKEAAHRFSWSVRGGP